MASFGKVLGGLGDMGTKRHYCDVVVHTLGCANSDAISIGML